MDFLGAVLDFAATEVELALKCLGLHAGWSGHEELLDLWVASECDFPKCLQINGHLAPADAGNPALGSHFCGECFNFGRRGGLILGEKEHGDREICVVFERVAELRRYFAEKWVGNLGEDAGAIARFHVGIHRAPVSHAADGGQRVVEDFRAPFPVQVGDGTHAAVVMFLGKAVQGAGDRRGA